MSLITLRDVCKSYGAQRVLWNINLELQEGEVALLFGPSGSGKTTLCRTAALLDQPDSGVLQVLGRAYSFPGRFPAKDLPYPDVGFVHQQFFLWPHLTNRKNLLLAMEGRRDKSRFAMDEVVDWLSIADVLDKYPNQCSVGQKQRVAIARTLLLSPRFIFFDEITSALDLVQTRKVIDVVQRLRSLGIGSLLVSHDLASFGPIADKMHFLDAGGIAESGNSSILSSPESQALMKFLQ